MFYSGFLGNRKITQLFQGKRREISFPSLKCHFNGVWLTGRAHFPAMFKCLPYIFHHWPTCNNERCLVFSGCDHEFCTSCALYLCSTNSSSTSAHGPPGSIPCPLCRHGIVSFVKLPGTGPLYKENSARTSLSLTFCSCSTEGMERNYMETPFCKPDFHCTRISPLGSSFRSLSCQSFPSVKLSPSLCMGAPDTNPCLVRRSRCLRPGFRRSTSDGESRRSWFCSLNQYVATGSGCWKYISLHA